MVRDFVEEDLCFIDRCSSERYDPYGVVRLRMRDGDRNAVQQAESDEALLVDRHHAEGLGIFPGLADADRVAVEVACHFVWHAARRP